MSKRKLVSMMLAAVLTMTASATFTSAETTSDGKTYEITVSSHQTSSSVHHFVLDELKKRVEERTEGAVVVNLFEDAQLGNERDNIEGVTLGTIQMCLADTGYVASLTDAYNILQLPFLFRDYDHLNKVLSSDIVKEGMDAKLIQEHGVRPMGWYPDGLRDFLLNEPIENIDDFSGLKIRAMESDVVIDTINALGASATPIPWGDVYTSIQTNVVCGLEAAPSSLYAMKFYEVANNLVLTNHINLGVTLLINEAFYQSLPEEYQTILQEVMQEIVEEQQALTVEQQEKAIEDLKNEGCNVVEIDQAELQPKVESIWESYEEKIDGGKEMVEEILAVE